MQNRPKNQLNNQQLAAIKHTEGPTIIIAGPGSGKTRVITEKIAHLLTLGIPPNHILALTFTNKAAKEMKARIHNITKNYHAFSLWMGTFHSIFASILREEAHIINYTKYFTIYDNDDSVKIIRRIIKDKNLNKETYNPKDIFTRISYMKNNLIDSIKYHTYQELIKQDHRHNREQFRYIYSSYCTECHKSNSMDFDDLLLNTYRLFNDHDALTKYQEIFKYILIDEYQDTNKVQDEIIKQLGKQHKNICVVGDDSQSIYSFRGANINNMLNFKLFYKDAQEFKLEQNYRSTQNIVNAANSLIAYNTQKIDKTIFSNKEPGEKLKLMQFYNDREEGNNIADIIEKSIAKNNTKKLDHAILYRTNSQSKVIEDGLRKRGITYKIFGGLSFYQRKEIKDIMAFLKLTINPKDDESILRIINYPTRGIGPTTVNKIRTLATESDQAIWEIISSEKIDEIKFTKQTKLNIMEFTNILKSIFECVNNNVFDILNLLIEKTGIIRRLKDDPTEENSNRIQNISELFNSVKLFSMRNTNNTLFDFINEITLDESKEEEEEEEEEETNKDQDYVSLMTIHQSKGLEFSNVYILGLENGLFPSQKSMHQPTLIEEERRLFYVAITRAIKSVTISYTLNRFKFGTISSSTPSMFLEEINYFFIEKKTPSSNHKPKQIHAPKPKIKLHGFKKVTKEIYRDNRNLKIGQSIMHNIFGKGEIKKIDHSDGNEKITVLFTNHGKKLLLTKFAKFEIII